MNALADFLFVVAVLLGAALCCLASESKADKAGKDEMLAAPTFGRAWAQRLMPRNPCVSGGLSHRFGSAPYGGGSGLYGRAAAYGGVPSYGGGAFNGGGPSYANAYARSYLPAGCYQTIPSVNPPPAAPTADYQTIPSVNPPPSAPTTYTAPLRPSAAAGCPQNWLIGCAPTVKEVACNSVGLGS